MGDVIRAHPVRSESHTQRNANGEVATLESVWLKKVMRPKIKISLVK